VNTPPDRVPWFRPWDCADIRPWWYWTTALLTAPILFATVGALAWWMAT
jgi:hypothetical protein